MALNSQKLFILDATQRPELQDDMVNRRLSGRLPGYFRTFIRKTRFWSRKIFTFWHFTVFAPPFYNFLLFFLKTSCYKTFVAQKFEVLLYTLELTRIFPNRVTEPKNRQIFTFFQFSARDQPFFIFSS